MDHPVRRAIVADFGDLSLRVVEEVEVMSVAARLVDDLRAVQCDISRDAIHRFPASQSILVVDEGRGDAPVRHLLQLPPVLPGVGPGPVIERVPDRVIRDRLRRRHIVRRHADRRQLVLPVGCAIAIGEGLLHGPRRADGIGVPFLRQDIPAAVVFPGPGSARVPAGQVRLVIHTDQLTQPVVGVSGFQPVACLAGDVSRVRIGIGATLARLCHPRDQRRRVAAVAARGVGAGGLIGCAPHRQCPLQQPADAVVGIGQYAPIAVIQPDRAVLPVVGEPRPVVVQ